MALTLDEAVDAASAYIGVAGDVASMVVEADAIRRFADAIGDSNPLYSDLEYARATRWGGIVAPPTFVCVLVAPLPLPNIDYGAGRLNGGTVFENLLPVRPGHVISGQARLTAVRGVKGRSSDMLVTEREVRYTNQDGRLTVVMRSTSIQR